MNKRELVEQNKWLNEREVKEALKPIADAIMRLLETMFGDITAYYEKVIQNINVHHETQICEAKLEVLREVRERILGIGRYDIPKSRSVIAVIDHIISELEEEKK